MVIGEKLKAMREQKHLSQGDIEKRRASALLYFPRGERPHRTGHRDSEEDGSSTGSADVRAFHGRRPCEDAQSTGRICFK